MITPDTTRTPAEIVAELREMIRLPNIHFHYTNGRDACREAADLIERLTREAEDVKDELADAWPEDREAVLAGDPVHYIAKLIAERDNEIMEAACLRGTANRLEVEAVQTRLSGVEAGTHVIVPSEATPEIILSTRRAGAIRSVKGEAAGG